MNAISLVEFLAVVLTALALVPAMAHVMELPNKLPMSLDAYMTVQRMYRGWNKSAIVSMGAVIFTLILLLTADGDAFVPALVAFLAIAASQVVFWVYTNPVNRLTRQWTLAPYNWQTLRDRWEFSHAVAAVLNFIAVVSVTIAVVRS